MSIAADLPLEISKRLAVKYLGSLKTRKKDDFPLRSGSIPGCDMLTASKLNLNWCDTYFDIVSSYFD